jgi:hypothetical protein
MKNRDAKMRERYLSRENDRLERMFEKMFREEKKKFFYPEAKRITVQRYVHMAFLYACESCCERHLMWIEKGLEEACNPKLKEKSGLPHKPTPFVIRCPRCGGFMRHISTPFCLDKFAPASVGDNLFINDENCECGKPVFCWEGGEGA